MNSLIVRTLARLLAWLQLALAIVAWWRGHQEPGGGFIGGLLAGGALTLLAFAYGPDRAARALRVHPMRWIGLGLVAGLAGGMLALGAGRPFFTGVWTEAFGLHLGSPMLFDLGVMLVVIGVTSSILLNFWRRDAEPEPPAGGAR